jgi:hypothetical protein
MVGRDVRETLFLKLACRGTTSRFRSLRLGARIALGPSGDVKVCLNLVRVQTNSYVTN